MLDPGDVLIKKVKYGKKKESTVISTVQAVVWAGASIATGKSVDPTNMHVAMFVGKGELVEESGKGLVKRKLTADRYIVFRWKSKDGVAQKAAEIMERWTTTLKLRKVYGGLPIPILCSSPLFIPQLLGNSWYGPGATFRRWKHRHGWHGTMICSEAVIVAYQLAADEIKNFKGNPIKLDSKLSSPMRLEGYLSTDNRWEKVGEYIKTPAGYYAFTDEWEWDQAVSLLGI